MPYEETVPWLKSGKHAQLDGIRARPMGHCMLLHHPLVVLRGQAGAVFLLADDGTGWILKKFHFGRSPDESYLRSISRVLPHHDGFLSGTNRRVLSQTDLKKEPGCYYSPELQHWVGGTVLMPRVKGVDWATVADELRDGSLHLDRDQRVTLCRNLAELVRLLEASGCAHRDISSGNTFIDTTTWAVILIDFDSIYHSSLRMPCATTCGTEGYTGPFVWKNGSACPDTTWCPQGDRFAMALVSVEFLVLDKRSPLGAEGGMFDQEGLRARNGPAVRLARERLRDQYPAAMPLFEAAINSHSCPDCPGPEDWIRFCDSLLGPSIQPPALQAVEHPSPDDFAHILQKRISAPPVWPAPRLEDLPLEPLGPRSKPQPKVPLPEDPWLHGSQTSCTDASSSLRRVSPNSQENP